MPIFQSPVSVLNALATAIKVSFPRKRRENIENIGSNNRNQLIWDLVGRTYNLGFLAFGGPPVHFQIFHQRFVQHDHNSLKEPWIDEQTYIELFAICQALPGPASTKMLFCIALLRAGLSAAFLVFLFWSLPGSIAMYGLALGVRRIGDVLPEVVYAFLSGLNAATVGTIALAAVQLSRKTITDPLSRLLVLLGACAGVCYNALWYFPVLMVTGGLTTLIWDCYLRAIWNRRRLGRQRRSADIVSTVENNGPEPHPISSSGDITQDISPIMLVRRNNIAQASTPDGVKDSNQVSSQPKLIPRIPVMVGIGIIVTFFAIFAAVITTRGLIDPLPLAYRLFSSMFLAGTIIFGGGPVVIPLLREYVVEPGFVSSRDFLLGLAIIQACPGPNFNFAVFLGALTLLGSSSMMALGAFLAFVGIFTPGMILAVGFQSLWRAIRSNPQVVSVLRGVNATAVGLVFTAVYRLWEIGYLTLDGKSISLGRDPWWVVVTATTFVSGDSFGVPAPLAIISGGVLGITWWGVVGH